MWLGDYLLAGRQAGRQPGRQVACGWVIMLLAGRQTNGWASRQVGSMKLVDYLTIR